MGPDREVVRETTHRATAAQAHRGPDDEGVTVQPFGRAWLGLGHRRLSILDLSPLGHQPMVHATSGCALVFNGEIYNFKELRCELVREGEAFHSGTDTEVLLVGLVRHGDRFLNRLGGMYAFAFYDPRAPRLLLARDPAGMKPLYLAEGGGTLCFASEVRALLATGLVKREIDRRGLAGYLAYGAVQHPFTLFRGVSSVPAGSCLEYRVGPSGEWYKAGPACAFWQLPAPEPCITEDQAVAAIRQTLDAAAKSHLVADVPVGLFLSSGLDSTIMAGLAARHTPRLKSFTVAFADQPDFSEQRLAAETAAQFGLEHTEIQVPMAAAEAAARDWLGALDQPSMDGLNVFLISREVRRQGIKAALAGLGGDELFGGYPSFRDVPRLRRMMRFVRPIPSKARRRLAGVATLGRSRAVRAKLKDMLGGDGSVRSLYLQRRRTMSDQQMAGLGISAADVGLGPAFLCSEAYPDLDQTEADPVRLVSQLEFRLYQGNMLLRDGDANGMAFGLEIRFPFLDQRLIELAHAIPGGVRLPAGAAGKHLLRRAFADLLRPDISTQPKQGFVLPIRRWMLGSLRQTCEQALTTLKDSRILNPDGVDGVWREFLAEPESPMWTRAFALAVLGAFVGNTGASS